MAEGKIEEKEEMWKSMIDCLDDSTNKLALVLLDEKNYSAGLSRLVRKMNEHCNKICYVCLSKPFSEVMDDLRNEKADLEKFFFVDIFSSHNYNLEEIGQCAFVQNPEDLKGISEKIKDSVVKHSCTGILFDTVSTLLLYHQVHSIIKFTHELISDDNQKNARKVYLVVKEKNIFEEESTKLINDLYLFADTIIDINK